MRGKVYHGRIFYGWIIVIAGIFCMGVTVGINNCASQFIKPVCADLGFTRQAMNMNQTIVAAGGMAVSLLSGKIFSKFRLKTVLRGAAIVNGISYFCYSFASSLPVFYLVSVIYSLSLALLTVIPFSILIGNWFKERYGLAIGLTFMGSGVGGMLFNALTGQWLTRFGWRTTYQLLAVIMLAVLLISMFLVIQANPYDMGLEPYGGQSDPALSEGKASPALSDNDGYTLKEAMRTARFWIIVLCTGVISISINMLNQSVAPHLSDVGYSVTASANVVSAGMAALAIGKIALGQLFDKFGSRVATLLSGGAVALGLLGLVFAHFPPMLAAVICGVGLGCAFGSVAYPIIARDVFGKREQGAIYGIIVAAANFGGIVAPIYIGAIFDHTGTYLPGFYTGIAFCVLSLTVYLYQFTKAHREKQAGEQAEAVTGE